MSTPIKIPPAETTIDRIVAYKKGAEIIDTLSDQEFKQMERADYADNLIRTDLHQTNKEIAQRIKLEFDVSLQTAHADIENAKRIHGSLKQYQKNYWINFLLEHARKALGMAYRNENVNQVISAIREMGKIVEMIPEESKDPLDKRPPNNYYMIINTLNQPAIRIDLNNVDKLKPEDVKAIEASIENEYLNSTFEIMNEQITS